MRFKHLRYKILASVLASFIFLIVVLVLLGFFGSFSSPDKEVKWGITFSVLQATRLNLDWRQTYLSVLDDLKPHALRLPVYWSEIEKEEGQFDFSFYDWQMDEAQKRDISTILIIGRRLPRWPECHVPDWEQKLDKEKQDIALLVYIRETVNHFKHYPNIYAWQIENEPFLSVFGECPETDANFLSKEVDSVKALDASRPVIITDSGELGDWLRAAKRADIFGTTMYRRVPGWGIFGKYTTYPLPSSFYRWKANFVNHFVPIRKLIVAELQGEPWAIGTSNVADISIAEQYRTVDPVYFKEIIKYAKNSGIGEIYWWGSEWWYWLKQGGHPEIWETAKVLFDGHN